ncbi:hypothetical protein [Desulfococcus sp.]|uniref:lipase family protein n=1 Tax=Desulfococcus sp. TaxID=2025834 RepID=UPI003594230C
MKFDYSWEAILRPGASNQYFHIQEGNGPGRPPFCRRTSGYSPVNAWWLSEISRLIYVREADETGGIDTGRNRNEILSGVNLREYCFFNNNGIQCALVTTSENACDPFGVLVFRGTSAFETWLSNLNTLQTDWGAGGLVHSGFKNEFFKIWERVDECLSGFPPDFPLFYTGHSLGGAMATLAASLRPPSGLYTFGSPRVGDAAFVQSLREVPIFRVVNNRDLVTLLPPSRIPFDFCHAGERCHYPGGGLPESGLSMENGISAPPVQRSRLAALKRRLAGPPEFLSDHAPVNYSLRLQQEIFLQSA